MRRISNINMLHKNICKCRIQRILKTLELFIQNVNKLNAELKPKHKIVNGKIEYGI